MQTLPRFTLGVMLALATGCDRSDLVALRVREPDAGAQSGASASPDDASLLGSGGAGGTAGASGGLGGGSGGISGGGFPTAAGGAVAGNGGGGRGGGSAGSGGAGSGGAIGSGGTIGSGGSTAARDAGLRDAGGDSHPWTDAGADGAPDATRDASVPQTCAVGSVPSAAGCAPVSLATKVSVGFVPCRIRADGTLWCWGQPETGWTPSWQEARYETQVGSASDWTDVTVGANGICGIRAPGSLWCFGRLYNTPGPFTENHDQPVQIGVDEDWLQVAGGSSGFCGIKQNGTLWCWGSIRSLDPATGSLSGTPVQVGTDSSWSLVSTNGNTTCAIRTNGSLECFGINEFGQLGDGTTTSRGEPKPILDPGPWVSVTVGWLPCGVRFDGTLWCWGSTLGSSPVRIDAATDWTTIVDGVTGGMLCGLRAGGRLLCKDPHAGPVVLAQTDAELGYSSVAAGCAEHEDGTVRCWGNPAFGDGSHRAEPDPIRVGTATDWTSVVLSGYTEMGLHAGGVLESRLALPSVAGPWLELALGDYTAGCAVRADHTLWCWDQSWIQQGSATDWLHVTVGTAANQPTWACGIREGGSPGQGTLWCSYNATSTTWFQAGSATDWVTLSQSHGPCGIHADGTLTCWTENPGGPIFTDVGTDHDWASVSAPIVLSSQCAIKTDESLWCWGALDVSNAWGQLGDGTRTNSLVPEHIAPGTHWAEVASGGYDTCGIQTDGSLWCWGVNTSGELGLGVPGTQRLVPTRVGSALDWEHIALSGWGGTNAFTCGIRAGELWCWGSNSGIGTVSWSPVFTLTPHVVVDPPPPGGGQFCPWPNDSDLDGYAACLGDCDDVNPDVNPSAVETCNGIDDNCDGSIDEGCP